MRVTPYASGNGWEVHHGDVLRLLMDWPADSIDGLVTDPPYSSGGIMRGDRAGTAVDKYVQSEVRDRRPDFVGDSRDQRSYAFWSSVWMAECHRIAVPGAFGFAFTDWRQLPATTDGFQAGGWVWRGLVAWDKTGAARPTKGRPTSQCEYVVWGTKGPHQPDEDAPCPPGFYTVPNRGERLHIAQKPLEVLTPLLGCVRPGGRVLDPFGGSGSTGVAALRTGRTAVLFDVMQSNCDLMAERLEAESRGVDVLSSRAGALSLFGAP